MASPRRIDVHFHLIPPFYREAVYEAGRGPAIGRYPDWTPELALELMDAHGIEVALTSLAQPGVGFGSAASAQAMARRCNAYAAELVARWPRRFGAFGTVPMWSTQGALDEIAYCLDTLKFDGISLFASYEENFLGDPALRSACWPCSNERGAVVFVHPGLHPSSKGLALPWPGLHDGIPVRHHPRGGEPHLLGRDRAFPARQIHPAPCRRARALFCLAPFGLADDRSRGCRSSRASRSMPGCGISGTTTRSRRASRPSARSNTSRRRSASCSGPTFPSPIRA